MAKAPSAATMARRKNARDRRERVLAEGGRRIEVLLLPDAAAALTALEEGSGDTATTIITGLLIRATNRKRSKD